MRVLVTRPEPEARSFAEALAARGHEALLAPMLRLVPLPPPADLAERLAAAQAILLTSSNGAQALADATKVRGYRIFAVGDTTARAARQLGFADVTSASGDSQALAALASRQLAPADGPLIHASGAARTGDLAGVLRATGFRVDEIALYDMRPVAALPDGIAQAIQSSGVDAATFFSPRTAQAFVKVTVQAGLAPFLASVAAVAISPAALNGADGIPWRTRIAARAPTQDGVLAALDALTPAPAGSLPMSDDKKPTDSPAAGKTEPTPSTDRAAAAADDRFSAPPAMTVQPRRGVGVVGAFLSGIVASIIVLGGALALLAARPDSVRRWLEPPPSAPGLAHVTEDALAASLKPLESRLAQLEAKARVLDGVAAQATQLKDVQDRLAAQATRLAALQELAAKIDALPRGGDPEAMARLAAQLTQTRQELAAARADVAALKSRQEAAETAVRALSAQPAPAPGTTAPDSDAGRQIAALLERLDRLEKRDAQLSGALAGAVDSAGLARAVAEAEARLREQLARSGADIERTRETAAKLAERLAALDSDVAAKLEAIRKDVVVSVAGDRRASERDRAAAAIGIAARLRQAIEAGGPFVADAELLKPLAADDPAVAAIQTELATLAAAGVSTRRQLAAEFAEVARRVIAADLADDSWGERLLGKLKELVAIRRVGEDAKGATPEAILARAEAAIEAGDLTKAVAEMKGLKSPADAPARDWLQRAESHLVAQRAIDRLGLHGIALLSRIPSK